VKWDTVLKKDSTIWNMAGIHFRSLSDCCHPRPERPGTYSVEAVFVYSDLGGWPAPDQDLVSWSGAVEIEVSDPQPGDRFRTWRLR
jgi:hypothetical protein